MKFAKDLFSERYPWLNQPDDANYRNLARAFNTAVKDFKKIKLPKPKAPSKRSIGYQLVDSALNNQMTNQFSAPLIREMSNKYTAGNIYNFLMWNRALSATEILQNYNSTKTRFGL
jgi:hypothetical protein